MKRIIFVDDEANILSGLKRMLRPMRKEWDMHFAGGAEEALTKMADEPFDIVVTDMRMPGRDGAWLLEQVKELYPDTARIVLSGHAEHDMTVRSVAAAHQFLAKPCDADTLRATVLRTCRLRDMMANKPLQRLATSIGQLPSVPEIYREMSAEMAKPEPSLKAIGKIVGSDLAMSAKVLQLVNSAFFGLRRRIASLDHAVTYLGLDVIRSLVLSESAFKSLSHKRCPVSAEQLMRDGQRAAHLAKAIARHSSDSKIVPDEAFQAGLLCRLGTLILASSQPDDFRKLQKRINAGDSEPAAMREIFGVTEGEIGGYLLGLWGLSDAIVEAIVSAKAPQETETTGLSPLVALHVAQGLIAEWAGQEDVVNTGWLEQIGLADELEAWREIADAQFEKQECSMNKRILFVDDEPNILQAIKRAIRKEYDVVTAIGPEAGLEAVANDDGFAMIVSDMRMPGMNGVEFLRAAKQLSPESVRVMLTGNSDQQTAIEAVNGGEVFRFLTKPCDVDVLRNVLEQGLRQYQLLRTEQELLGLTLKGCISVLADLLSMSRPDAFGRTCRLRNRVTELLSRRPDIAENERWAIETATMLSQLGCVSVAPQILAKIQRGELLESNERKEFSQATSHAADLIGKVPRMEPVAEIVRYQHKHYNGNGYPEDPRKAEAIPLGARALHLIQAQDELRMQGFEDEDLTMELARRKHEFDPRLLELVMSAAPAAPAGSLQRVAPGDLKVGMEINEDVSTNTGSLVVCEGQKVTPAVLEHLQRFIDDGSLVDPIAVLVTEAPSPAVAATG